MNMNRRQLAVLVAVLCSMVMISCGNRFKEKPFGGLNGRVQKVTVYHLMPEVWHAGSGGTDVMKIITSIYDVYGNEIYSAVQDSAERVQVETESLYEDGVSIRSSQKSGGRTVATLNLISKDKGTLEYNKEMNGRFTRMTVKESSFLRRNKSVVTENGKVTTVSVVKTDRQGYPVKITITDSNQGTKSIQTNRFDENHNIIEKHLYTEYDIDGTHEQSSIIFEYGEMDEHGNWKDCRTYNEFRIPLEVLVREIEYWD